MSQSNPVSFWSNSTTRTMPRRLPKPKQAWPVRRRNSKTTRLPNGFRTSQIRERGNRRSAGCRRGECGQGRRRRRSAGCRTDGDRTEAPGGVARLQGHHPPGTRNRRRQCGSLSRHARQPPGGPGPSPGSARQQPRCARSSKRDSAPRSIPRTPCTGQTSRPNRQPSSSPTSILDIRASSPPQQAQSASVMCRRDSW